MWDHFITFNLFYANFDNINKKLKKFGILFYNFWINCNRNSISHINKQINSKQKIWPQTRMKLESTKIA